jgi:hypothetical protein
MRVYQFRHVGIVLHLLFTAFATLPPTCAIISGFVVLRQINFFTLAETPLPTCCISPRITLNRVGLPRKTEIIAQQFQMSKRTFSMRAYKPR